MGINPQGKIDIYIRTISDRCVLSSCYFSFTALKIAFSENTVYINGITMACSTEALRLPVIKYSPPMNNIKGKIRNIAIP